MPALFAVTLFVSASLLFVVQPMVARLVLPVLGGSPGVWNTCMVFFQSALLAGYAYAHLVPGRLSQRGQIVLHALLLFLPLLVLPLRLPGWSPPVESSPVFWLLGVLGVAVGLPFFVVSSSAPLLQRWFSRTGHPSASDPYFLYAASNLGSMIALLGYPFLIEPYLPLRQQAWAWSLGYGLLVALTLACAVAAWRSPASAVTQANTPAAGPGRGRIVRWVLLALVPSSLTLSVTTYLSTDLASIPLLWVVPLALYLLTFILVFARRLRPSRRFLARWMPLLVILLVLALVSEATEPVELLIGLHLAGLFWVSLVCHGELAEDRPPAEHLTGFYLWISVGGVLGGVFNALLAPLLFSSVVEYPLVLALACLLRPAFPQINPAPTAQPKPGKNRKVPTGWTPESLDVLIPVGLGLGTAGVILVVQGAGVPPGPLSVAAMFAGPVLICYLLQDWPLRFGLGVAGVLLASALYRGVHGGAESRERSFFGVHRVTIDPTGTFRQLIHGNTVHGQQSLSPARRREPLTYYHRTGPAGQVFASLRGDPRLNRVGVVGLGVGALAAYGEPGQEWTFFEIDPVVLQIARDTGQFTFLRDSPTRKRYVLGDARLTLTREEGQFGVLVIDAFSSDAIPVHLLTREALAVYRARLSPGGLLLFNISNRYLDLRPVLAALAREAGMPCAFQEDLTPREEEKAQGKAPSVWGVLAQDEPALRQAIQKGGWSADPGRRPVLWTDDRCDVLSVFRWERLLGQGQD